MDSIIIMEYIHQAESFVGSKLDYSLSNPYVMAVIKVSLALYAAQLAPAAPAYLQNLFKNTFASGFVDLVRTSYNPDSLIKIVFG